jgi:hypothetical protein
MNSAGHNIDSKKRFVLSSARLTDRLFKPTAIGGNLCFNTHFTRSAIHNDAGTKFYERQKRWSHWFRLCGWAPIR